MREIPYSQLLQWFQEDYSHEPECAANDAPPPYLARFYDALDDTVHAGEERSTALDLGCGGGANTVDLARRGYRVTAIDVAGQRSVLGRARRLALDHIQFIASDITVYPFEQTSYDCILCTRVLHLLPADSIAGVASRVRAALRPGGVVYIDVLANIRRTFQDTGEEFTYTGLASWSEREAREFFTSLFAGWEISHMDTVHEEVDWPIKPGDYPVAPYHCSADLVCVVARHIASPG